jgi:hypothetical protein
MSPANRADFKNQKNSLGLKMNVIKVIELLIVFFTCVSLVYSESEPLVGGPCVYKQYEGRAKIISIFQKSKPHNYTHELYEVKFSFTSDHVIEDKLARTKGKEFVLLLSNSAYPGPRFLEKYDIQVGKIFECNLKVIVGGTCTPRLFEFPTIKLDDYFER